MLNNRERVINGGFRVTRGATIEVAGTDFAYHRNSEGENLKATGPIDVDVEIEVHKYIGLYICTYYNVLLCCKYLLLHEVNKIDIIL